MGPVAGVVLLAGIVGLIARLATRVRVMGPSMAPTLCDGDRVLVNRLAYLCRRPAQRDVVLARMWGSGGDLAIKRVGGLPGQAVPARGGSGAGTDQDAATAAGVLGRDEYALLGDNAAASTDSRDLGPVRRAHIVGQVWYRYWPPERRGPLPLYARRVCR